MKSTYSFLSDNLALQEIRKHKWIESEKQGKEIGFASAAIDWITKYGPQWQMSRHKLQDGSDPFSEKRQYRRFYRHFPVKIKIGQTKIESYTDDINLLGLACTIPHAVRNDSTADVTIRFLDKGKKKTEEKVHFQTHVARVTAQQAKQKERQFNVYLPFSEEIKSFIRARTELLMN